MENKEQSRPLFSLSVAPHIRHGDTVSRIMLCVIISLLPAFILSVYYFGFRSPVHCLFGVGFAVIAEALVQRLRKIPLGINDYSAVLTGLLLAFNVPPNAPYWISAVGSVFAIVVAKQAFGGLGFNFINPALAGRAFLLSAWPVHMTSAWRMPKGMVSLSGMSAAGIDGITSSTPLAALKSFPLEPSQLVEALPHLMLGNVGGCIGETSVVALLAGAIFLLIKRYIDFRIPLFYIGTVALLTWIFNGSGTYFSRHALIVPVYHMLSGGLILGAFFMATDMVTTPLTPFGRMLFGMGCGGITVLIRLVGGYPEGVSYSILLMNVVAPLLDRIKAPKIYGNKRPKDE